ncbi:MAG: NPCBM/NEW2 domain-containing protein [Planctomycetota bacterium]
MAGFASIGLAQATSARRIDPAQGPQIAWANPSRSAGAGQDVGAQVHASEPVGNRREADGARAASGRMAERLELELRGGEVLLARSLTGTVDGGEGLLAKVDAGAGGGGGPRRISMDDLLAVRSGVVRPVPLLRVELVGGGLLHGAISGGDVNGDTLELQTPVFGRTDVMIDRLSVVAQPGVHPADQRLPEGVDEGVFVATGRGYDLVAGTLHRFGAQGVHFQPDGQEEPVWYAARKFSSLRLRGGLPAEQAGGCLLVSRLGDRVDVELVACRSDGVDVQLESGAVASVRWADVACLVFTPKVVHLSSIEPSDASERGIDGPVVHPWRRDRAVVGGTELQAHARAYGRGIGMHSFSRLRFVAPAGATHFRSRVALDDTASALPFRAAAEVRVLRDDEVVYEAKQLEAGAEPRDVGLHEVQPGQEITLEVDFGPGRELGDRVDWLLPVFLLGSGA